VGAVGSKTRGFPEPIVANRPTTVPAAYEYYLHGKLAGARMQLPLAEEMLRKALAIDPSYAPAWALLATIIAYVNPVASPGTDLRSAALERQQRALDAAEKAVRLAPDLSDGYEARGYVRWLRAWDWAGARADLEHALRLDPGNARALRVYQFVLDNSFGERERAAEALRRSAELDPMNLSTWGTMALMEADSGHLGRARETVRRAFEIRADAPLALSVLAEIELLDGRPAEALAIYQRPSPLPEEVRLAGEVMALHDLGNEPASHAALTALTERFGFSRPYSVAYAHAWRGERDEAVEWLERAYATRADGMVNLLVDVKLRALYGDPRFAALLRKMSLPDVPRP
jgi:tetratricopeptide (TPR) repeat protein